MTKNANKGELNVANRTLFICDNIGVLDGMNSECVDLIYLDPPFNSNRHYSAPIGSKAAGAAFKDAWTLDDIDLAWLGQIAERHPSLAAVINAAGLAGGKGDKAYLVFMARRLLEMHRILKPSGSIYLHCDPTMSHSLKMLMDSIFGRANFRNEIAWCYVGGGNAKTAFNKKHDVIFFYAKRKKLAVFNWKDVAAPYDKIPLTGQWRKGFTDKQEAAKRAAAKYEIGKARYDWWTDIPSYGTATRHTERTGYPTQKPDPLLERIIKASSREGDVVFDPFCGCATACVAAETLGRRWIGVDLSETARGLVTKRLRDAQDMLSTKGAWKKVSVRTDSPVRTDEGDLMVNPKEYSHELYGMQNGKCAGCRNDFPFRNMTVDHKDEPKAKGGQNIKPNLQLLCGWCNSVKGARPMSYLLARLKKEGIID